MKRIFCVVASLLAFQSVVLSQNYTLATKGTDTEPLSLQKISYQLLQLSNTITTKLLNTVGTNTLTESQWMTNVNATLTGGASSVTNFATIWVTNTLTRTSGDYTTAYSAGDVISAGMGGATNPPITLSGALPSGKGKIVAVLLSTDSVTPIGTFRIWPYSNTNVTWVTDNVAYGVYHTNAPSRFAPIDVVMAAGTVSSWGANEIDQRNVFSTGTNLFIFIQTLSAFTPTAFTNVHLMIGIQPLGQ